MIPENKLCKLFSSLEEQFFVYWKTVFETENKHALNFLMNIRRKPKPNPQIKLKFSSFRKQITAGLNWQIDVTKLRQESLS